MTPDFEVPIGKFRSRVSAEAFRSLLESEGVSSSITPQNLIAGLEADFVLSVPQSQLHRARWLLSESEFSDAELTYLATGELPKPE
jgi:hypothetical protein